MAVHDILISLDEDSFKALRDMPRSCRCLTDSKLIGLLLRAEARRLERKDEELQATIRRAHERMQGHA